MQKLVAKLTQVGFEKIYESDFGEPIKYLIKILSHKTVSVSGLESLVAEKGGDL